MKATLCAAAIFAFTFLAGCGGSPEPDSQCHELPTGQRDCSAGGRIVWPFRDLPAEVRSDFDAGLFAIDLSESNVPIESTSGYATITLELEDETVLSNSFEWIKAGDEIVAVSPAAVNDWLQPHLSFFAEAEIELSFVTGSGEGVNVVVTEYLYSGSLQAGDSYSWYGGGGGGGCSEKNCEIR